MADRPTVPGVEAPGDVLEAIRRLPGGVWVQAMLGGGLALSCGRCPRTYASPSPDDTNLVVMIEAMIEHVRLHHS